MKIFREQFNTIEPLGLSENGKQVALNIVAATIFNDKGETINGYSYDVVAFDETDYNYPDSIKIDVAKVFEAKDYLYKTEHKFNTDYELKEDETPEIILDIKARRSAARALVRSTGA